MTRVKTKINNLLKKLYCSVAMPVLEANNELLLRKTARLLSIAQLHQKTFLKFKGCNKGKSIVIIGAGPSVKQFKPMDNCIYIGLNRAFLLGDVKFDYLFTIDKLGIEQYYEGFGKYNCVKFVGDQNLGPHWQIPETEIAKMQGNVYQYKTDMGIFDESHFTLDIDSQPLGNFNTVSLQAMQFALYTLPKKIYLVGIDCSEEGHFNTHQKEEEALNKNIIERGENVAQNANSAVLFWKQLKEFADLYYPGIEIISVNPVGLRGLFKDFDQE